jgi:hypothetical protein
MLVGMRDVGPEVGFGFLVDVRHQDSLTHLCELEPKR